MILRIRHGVFLGALALCGGTDVHASGGSYNVDDASVVGAGKCQLESWLRAWSNGSDGLYTVPACGVGPLELGVTLNTGHDMRAVGVSPAVKWQLRNGDDQGVGVAVAAGTAYEHGRQVDAQAYAAVTFAIDDARRFLIALNAGTDRTRHEHTHALYGGGITYTVTARVALIAERLWTHRTITDQGGIQFAFGESTLDLVVGSERSREHSHWINLGWNAAF